MSDAFLKVNDFPAEYVESVLLCPHWGLHRAKVAYIIRLLRPPRTSVVWLRLVCLYDLSGDWRLERT